MAEINWVKTVWIPAQINLKTEQASTAVYEFKTLNLKISAIENLDVRNWQGSADIVAPKVTVDIVDASLSDADTSSSVTFTFSEAVDPASVVLSVEGGTLSALTWNADHTGAT
ncbi:Ig-like domain-containing protein, partial [Alsobacter sp. SYSU M60028]|nr:Ig-like domain-containing protein [Alsobacter ponti]